MAFRRKLTLVALVVFAAVPMVAAAVPPVRPAAAAAQNPAPEVVPSIREWSGGSGSFELDARSRIVVDSGALAGEARMLRDDLAAVTGFGLRLVTGKNPEAGDLFLSDHGAPAELGREGYALDIGDRVELRGGSSVGVFYGTQTVLQMLRATPGQRTLPRGEARDWPRFRERGYMLDVGRRYWSPDYIVQTIREMAYLKLNTLARGVHEGRHPPVRGCRQHVSRDDHP